MYKYNNFMIEFSSPSLFRLSSPLLPLAFVLLTL